MKWKVLIIMVGLLLIYSNFSQAAPKKRLFDDIPIMGKTAECIADFGPSVNEIHQRAIKYARISPEDISRWKKRIKVAALMPRLQFGYERKVTDGIDIDLDDSVSVTSSGVNVGPTAGGWGRSLDRNNNFEVKAVWYLDELLFNRDDLSISSEARAQISARRNLLGEITDNYFELKRLVSLYKTNSPEAKDIRGKVRFEIDKMIGRLDSLTNGWFTARFKWKGVKCG
jgi:hypothetical protein